MRRSALAALSASAVALWLLFAAVGPYDFSPPDSGYTLDDPLPVLSMPFKRAGDPILLQATTSPQQYQVNQPAETKSYRAVNPCTVDVRIKTVASMSDKVSATTGTRFLARTSETLGSSTALTTPRIVSIMTTADPGPDGCWFELGYGNGG